jgi:fibronectin type 3 domain-containing protein
MKALIREPSRPLRPWSSRLLVVCTVLAAAMGCNQSAAPDTETKSTTTHGEGRRSSALTSGIQFVQLSYVTPQSAVSSVSIKYVAAQTAGNLNVVAVGWNDTSATVSSVTDTVGNVYTRIVGPQTYPGALSLSIYYSVNIQAAAAGANSVKVVFSKAAQYADVRALEYAGIDINNPIDVTSSGSGISGTADSGPATTTNAYDLLFAANMTSAVTNSAGSGWTNRIITDPDADLVEDRIVNSTGTYRATASVIAGSPWLMQLVAFRGAPTDTQPPSAPGPLAATAFSSARIDLSWSAATDNVGVAGYLVERCQGGGCSSFTQIASLGTVTTFSDTGLAPNSSYSYRVRAKDAVGNLGPYSTIATTSTLPDTTPPTAPATLSASAFSSSRIDLSWSAATDNVGIAGYRIERCTGAGCSIFAEIAAPAGTGVTYQDTTVAAGTSYSYQVRAYDLAGNLGPYSPVATTSTPVPDTTPPGAPATLSATAVSNAQVNLSWAAAVDDVAVTGYLIERCQGANCSSFAQIAAPPGTGTTYGDAGLNASTAYSYRVRATDAAGNLGSYSPVATATTLATPPAPVIPKFVQGNFATPQSAKTSVVIPFTGAQHAGNFNVVVVGWDDTTANVTGVTDTSGNVYTKAIGPTQLTDFVSQSIYYATGIAGANPGANKVTVTFSPAGAYPDIRILEYTGVVQTNPVDVAVGATGNGTTSSSGPLTTTNSVDLLVSANYLTSLTHGPASGWTMRMLTDPDGDIVEDRVVTSTGSYTGSAPMDGTGFWVMQTVAFKAAPQDTTPPNVAVTAPTGGAALTGTVTVTVTANDPDSGLQAIQLLVDGAAVGTIAGISPASFSLNTALFANGAHTIGASGLNGQRGTGYASPVAVTFSNASPGNPAVTGLVSPLVTLPIVPVHVSQMPDSRILMSDGQSLGGDARTWDTLTNSFNNVPVPANVFCSGHEQMADGRIFVTGGHNGGAHIGLPVNNAFDPATETWTVLANMSYPRWYPTATTLPDGRELVIAGETSCPGCNVLIPELYTPSTNTWTKLTTASKDFGSYYPHVYVLPSGKVLVATADEQPIVSQLLDLSTGTWSAVGGPAVEGGSSAMYLPGKILKSGKTIDPDETAVPSTAAAYVIDMSQATPTWRTIQSMQYPRTYHTLTVLPDGSVLASGGGPTTAPTDVSHAIRPVELFNPVTETWTPLASLNTGRLYHSSALLMPDARVLILGGGRFDDAVEPTDQYSAEFFSPPYLFKGPRPLITSAPSSLQLGQPFTVQTPDAARIASVVLLRLASVTHDINMAQRYVPLSFTAGSGSLSVTAPANNNIATKGNYMLFLVDTNGVPSIAAPVRL